MKKVKYAEQNFDATLLPKTRKAQFKDIVKNEWKALFGIGFILFLFSLPYILLYIFRYVGSTFYMSYLMDGGASEETIAFNFVIFRLIFDAANIIPYAIFGIGLSGVLRIYNNLIYGEGVLFKQDFISGIKKNWKGYFSAMIVFGILKAIYRFGTGLLLFHGSTLYSLLNGIFIIAFYVLIIPILMYMVALYSRYNMTFIHNLEAASRFALLTIIPTALFSILLFFVIYLPLIAQLFIIILVITIITILVIPFYILLWRLYVAYVFDKYINATDYPDFYRKGLSKEKEN